jgi:hypothetical protein
MQAGWPREYDGTSLASMSVPQALTALTGLTSITTITAPTGAYSNWESYLQATFQTILSRYPTVMQTKTELPGGNTIDPRMKLSFAYPVLGWSESAYVSRLSQV